MYLDNSGLKQEQKSIKVTFTLSSTLIYSQVDVK